MASGLVKSSHEVVCLWIKAARRMSDLVQATSSQASCLVYVIHNPLLPSLIILCGYRFSALYSLVSLTSDNSLSGVQTHSQSIST